MKAIDALTVTQKGYNFVFLRIANNVAWFAVIDGKNYGDYITANDNIKEAEEVEELFSILADQAAASITEITGVSIDGGALREEVKKRLS